MKAPTKIFDEFVPQAGGYSSKKLTEAEFREALMMAHTDAGVDAPAGLSPESARKILDMTGLGGWEFGMANLSPGETCLVLREFDGGGWEFFKLTYHK
jgi:hypothetical protein